MARGSYGIRRLTEFFDLSRDVFDRNIAGSVGNDIDIASHYTYSPERLRLFADGTRQFVQYNDITGFSDDPDVWTISPAQGETWHMESAESSTYVVNYETQHSQAFGLTRSLQSGDVFRWGMYNGTDGYLLEQRGADHTDTQADVIQSVAGAETTLASDIRLYEPLHEWNRFAAQYAWCASGRQEWTQSYTDDGAQYNKVLATTSNDTSRGPETGNLNVWIELERGQSTDAVGLEVGSMQISTFGDPAQLTRDKPQFVEVDLPADDDTWIPVYAIKILDGNDNVNATLNNLKVINYGGQGTIELVAANMSPGKTDATDFSLPSYHHQNNSALRATENISEVPNADGTQKQLTAGEKFGGYTLSTSIVDSGGNTQSTAAESTATRVRKKQILSSDYTVILARADSGGSTLRFLWDATQNW